MKRTLFRLVEERGSSRTLGSHHTVSFISRSVVCTSLTGFGHVVGLSQVPKYFLQKSILSRTLGTFISQGIPGVRECWPLHILLHHLSPLEVGL